MIVVKAGSESEIESAIGEAVKQQAKALSIGNDAYLSSRSRQIAFFALRRALPTMSESRDGVAAGLLMSYGPNQAETFRQAGLHVGRILKGEKPAVPLFGTAPSSCREFYRASSRKTYLLSSLRSSSWPSISRLRKP
jgi:ABC-type uncharacterized transport system substrate-binding protein